MESERSEGSEENHQLSDNKAEGNETKQPRAQRIGSTQKTEAEDSETPAK
jgi:hypothetical protein